MRPHWLPHRRVEEASELDAFLPPDPNRVIHGQPTKDELAQAKSYAIMIGCFLLICAFLAPWVQALLNRFDLRWFA